VIGQNPDRTPRGPECYCLFITITAEVVSFTLVAEDEVAIETLAVLSRRRIPTRLHLRGGTNWAYYGGDAGGMRYSRQTGAPYGMYRRFLQAASDLPCTSPPWGILSAVDMDRGTIKWQVPLGSMQYFGGGHEPVPPGSIGFGGPIITASGLVFTAGTFDPYIRALNVQTGKELWKAQLPASGNATPMTYSVNEEGQSSLFTKIPLPSRPTSAKTPAELASVELNEKPL